MLNAEVKRDPFTRPFEIFHSKIDHSAHFPPNFFTDATQSRSNISLWIICVFVGIRIGFVCGDDVSHLAESLAGDTASNNRHSETVQACCFGLVWILESRSSVFQDLRTFQTSVNLLYLLVYLWAFGKCCEWPHSYFGLCDLSVRIFGYWYVSDDLFGF